MPCDLVYHALWRGPHCEHGPTPSRDLGMGANRSLRVREAPCMARCWHCSHTKVPVVQPEQRTCVRPASCTT
jgi:hypothetical protein